LRPTCGSIENWWWVRVRSFTFKGAFTEYRMVTPTDQVLIAHVSANVAWTAPDGEALLAGWRKEHCVVLKE
jgi:hypothetical protein